jgi:hypothetical protein
MIVREGDGLFSYVYNPDKTYFKLPFLDRTTFNKDTGARALRTFNIEQKSMPKLNMESSNIQLELVKSLLNDYTMDKLLVIYMQTKLYNEFQSKILEENKKKESPDEILENISLENKEKLKPLFNDIFNDLDEKFLLLIEKSKITVDEAFSRASSTQVRKMAIQIGLGENKDLRPGLLTLVNNDIMEDIIREYGTPTIAEQLAIVVSKGDETQKQTFINEITTTKNYAEVVKRLKGFVLDIMIMKP